jgi:hypothetical protein
MIKAYMANAFSPWDGIATLLLEINNVPDPGNEVRWDKLYATVLEKFGESNIERMASQNPHSLNAAMSLLAKSGEKVFNDTLSFARSITWDHLDVDASFNKIKEVVPRLKTVNIEDRHDVLKIVYKEVLQAIVAGGIWSREFYFSEDRANEVLLHFLLGARASYTGGGANSAGEFSPDYMKGNIVDAGVVAHEAGHKIYNTDWEGIPDIVTYAVLEKAGERDAIGEYQDAVGYAKEAKKEWSPGMELHARGRWAVSALQDAILMFEGQVDWLKVNQHMSVFAREHATDLRDSKDRDVHDGDMVVYIFKEYFKDRFAKTGVSQSSLDELKDVRELRSWARKFAVAEGVENAQSTKDDSQLGGIDLTADRINLEIRNSLGKKIDFNMDPDMLKRLENAPGFLPVIMDVKPMADLRGFLGLSKVEEPALSGVPG